MHSKVRTFSERKWNEFGTKKNGFGTKMEQTQKPKMIEKK
jgi:hypothetical protein